MRTDKRDYAGCGLRVRQYWQRYRVWPARYAFRAYAHKRPQAPVRKVRLFDEARGYTRWMTP